MTKCAVGGCTRQPKPGRKGMCGPHYYRSRRHGDPYGGRAGWGEVTAYFHAHLGEQGPGCLIWPFASSGGAGRIFINGRLEVVSRLACEHEWGPAPEPGMQAAHAPLVCHNRLCWRGTHLRWATSAENLADRALDGTDQTGERGPGARLTWADVEDIRRQYAAGALQRDLAAQYGIRRASISPIVNYKTWKV